MTKPERALRMVDVEHMKQLACQRAAQEVQDGMVLGLGTGSTVYYFLQELGRMVREGRRLTGVPTSVRTAEIATQLAIPSPHWMTSPIWTWPWMGPMRWMPIFISSKALGVHCCEKNHRGQCRPVCRCGGCQQGGDPGERYPTSRGGAFWPYPCHTDARRPGRTRLATAQHGWPAVGL